MALAARWAGAERWETVARQAVASDSAAPAGRAMTADFLVAEWVRVVAYLGEAETRAEQ